MARLIIVDSNALIHWFLGRVDCMDAGDAHCYSVVSEIEVLCWRGLSDRDADQMRRFLSSMQRINLPRDVREAAIAVRRDWSLKLPDAIIAGTALALGGALWSYDAAFDRVAGLEVLRPPLAT